MKLTASKLRQNIYQVMDRVLETGIPVEIIRRGKTLKLISVQAPSKLARLKKSKVMNCDPELLVHNDWSKKWKFFE